MRVVTKEEWEQEKDILKKELRKEVFIYPTDSIYGIGCDATNEALVEKIRCLKHSTEQPFSVIAPGKQWVYDNCNVTEKAKEWVEKLGTEVEIDGETRGISLILTLKNEKAVAPNVLNGLNSLSVRIPVHWFSKEIEQVLTVPIITTSANPTGEDFMTSLEDLSPSIKEGVKYCLYEGEKQGRPSTLIRLDEEEITFKKR